MEEIIMYGTELSAVASICVIVIAFLSILNWIISRASTKLGAVIVDKITEELKPLENKVDALGVKFDKFLDYERENISAHSRFSERLMKLENQQQILGVQIGFQQHPQSAPANLEST